MGIRIHGCLVSAKQDDHPQIYRTHGHVGHADPFAVFFRARGGAEPDGDYAVRLKARIGKSEFPVWFGRDTLRRKSSVNNVTMRSTGSENAGRYPKIKNP